MIVAASTECFAQLPFEDALQRIVDLEFAHVEIALHEKPNCLRPSEVSANLEKAVWICRDTHRLNVCGYSVEIGAAGDEHYQQFASICRLAKATKVVSLTVPSAEIGTPFNQEVEHLRKLVAIASVEGVLVSIRAQVDRLSQDTGTVSVLCDNVLGLGLTLDPSAYIFGPHRGGSIRQLLKYVYHVHLRDTSKDQLQVRVGQGEVEYGRLISQLRKAQYTRALSVHITEMPDVDHMGEMQQDAAAVGEPAVGLRSPRRIRYTARDRVCPAPVPEVAGLVEPPGNSRGCLEHGEPQGAAAGFTWCVAVAAAVSDMVSRKGPGLNRPPRALPGRGRRKRPPCSRP